MKTIIKKLFLGLFAVLTVLCFAFAGINFVGAEDIPVAKIVMNSGAAIRPADGEYGTGLRFFAKLSKADYDELVAADNGKDKLEFGIILTIEDFYDRDNSFAIGSGEWKEFVAGNENNPTDMYYLRGKCSPKPDTDDADNDGNTSEMIFMFSITDILDGNLARRFVAKAYYTTNGGETFVYSTAVAQRSIFDVATRAYEKYKDDANVTGIIDKVCEAYPNVSFSVADAEIEKKVGDKLTVKATLSDGKGSEIDAYATASAEKVVGMLTENTDGTYTINRLGNFTLTAALGFDSAKLGETKTQEIEIKNANTRNIDVATEMYTEVENTQTEDLALVDTDYYYEPIYKFDISGDTANIAKHLIRLTRNAMNEIYAGDYLLFDVYKEAAIKFAFDSTTVGGESGVFYTYAGPSSNGSLVNSKMYLSGVDGVGSEVTVASQGLSSGHHLGRWHTVAIKFEGKPASMALKITTTGGSAVIGYLKNFRIASEVTATTITNEMNILSTVLQSNGNSQKEIINHAGRVNTLKYTATDTGNSNSLSFVKSCSCLEPWENGKGSTFASFDIYADSDIDLSFMIQGKDSNGAKIQPALCLSDNAKYATNNLYDVKAYVAEREIDLTKEDINDYLNQWVTIRITLKADIQSIVKTSVPWCGCFYFNTVSGSATVYFSNMFLGKNA